MLMNSHQATKYPTTLHRWESTNELAQPGKHVRSLFKVTRALSLNGFGRIPKEEGRISDDNDSAYNFKKQLERREDLPEYIKTHVIAFRVNIK
jgi:hypothetical protein